MYSRFLTNNIKLALADTPVIFIMGARQSGKTTLTKELIDDQWTYLTFDDQAQLALAKSDPVGFIRNMPTKKIVLDEVQKIPELFVSIKQSVDEDRQPGRFLLICSQRFPLESLTLRDGGFSRGRIAILPLECKRKLVCAKQYNTGSHSRREWLAGSANALLLPRLSDSLAGRMEAIHLTTLSECEICNIKPTFLNSLLAGTAPSSKVTRIRNYLLQRVVTGCYPEPLQRDSENRITAWYSQYINTMILRDVKDLDHIEYPEKMSKLFKIISYYSSQLINFSDISNKVDLTHNTIKKYISLLEQLFLVEQLPSWHTNEYKRLVKTPKIHVTDTGLICATRGLTKEKLANETAKLGKLVESFVYNEIKKQANFIGQPLYFYHYRDKDQVEIDIIIENAMGEYIAIEVKSTASLNAKDFVGLKRFQNLTHNKFKIGIILYDGDHTTSFGDKLFAVPLGALWS